MFHPSAIRDQIFPLWIALLIFSPFIVDATITLIRRLLRKERIWEAHKSHYYQRLVQLGWGHRKTVLWEYALMLSSGSSALIAVQLSSAYQWSIMGAWVLIYFILMFSAERLERHNQTKAGL